MNGVVAATWLDDACYAEAKTRPAAAIPVLTGEISLVGSGDSTGEKRSASRSRSVSRVKKFGNSRDIQDFSHATSASLALFVMRCSTKAPSKIFRLVSRARSCLPRSACSVRFCSNVRRAMSASCVRVMR